MYLRKSRADVEAENRGEGETLARHEKILMELANNRGLPIKRIYKEIVSGETIALRPVVQELLSDIEANLYAGVLVMEVERLARGDTIDQGIISQTFKYSGTKIVTPQKVYDPNNEYDEEYFEFGLFMSRREYKTINRRLQTGRLMSVREGKYVGNKPPYGYDRAKIEHGKGFTLTPNEEEAKVVKLIFELYTRQDRLGVALIVRKLNDIGVRPRYSDVWSNATVQGILKNPVYIGKIRWNARKQVKNVVNGSIKRTRPCAKEELITLADGLHEPIIAIETWDKAQEYRSQNRRPATPNTTLTNPLAGLLVCGKCGRKIIRRPFNRTGKHYLMCTSTVCKNISSRYDYVEEAILRQLYEILFSFKLKIDEHKKYEIDHTEEVILSQFNKELGKLENQTKRLHDLLEQGIYTPEVFVERSNLLSSKMERVKKDILETEELLCKKRLSENRVDLIHKTDNALSLYCMLDTPERKNQLLKSIIKEIIYTKYQNGRWQNNPKDFKLDIIMKF